MTEVREALVRRGVTEYREQNVEIWKMAMRLFEGLGDLFEALEEPAPTEADPKDTP